MFGTLSKQEITLPHPTTYESPVSLKEAIGDIQSADHEFVPIRTVHLKFLSLLEGGQHWKNLPLHLQKEAMGKSFYLQGGKTGFYRKLAWEKPSPTLVTHPAMPATMLIHPKKSRPLSVQEYARIQQFPDKWVFAGNLLEKYKQIGNAVPIGLGLAAGSAIISHYLNISRGNDSIPKTSRYIRTSHLEFIPDFQAEIKPIRCKDLVAAR